MSKIYTKVSGITSLTDARYCAGMEVNVLGIQFDNQGVAALDRNHFVSISGWIEGPIWFGEFAGTEIENILEIQESYGLMAWQVTNLDVAFDLKNQQFSVALALELTQLAELEHRLKDLHPEYILIKTNGEFPNSTELDLLNRLAQSYQLVIEPISGLDDFEAWQKILPDCGIHLVSGEEERPGWMDLSGLQDILEAVDEL